MRTNILAAVAATLSLGLAPLAANAQDVPSYAQPGGDEQIRGRVIAFDGGYNVSVRDDRGFVDNVQLHQGTIINPTGITISPGMIVSILGYNAGSAFEANEVDTPYTFDAGVPYYGGHPWGYYGPSYSLGFFFGNAGWWHGNDFGGSYRYYGGARVYNNVNFNTIYRSGGYQGRNYVAPAGSGGYYGHSRAYLQARGYYNGGTTNHTYVGGTASHAYVAPQANGYQHNGGATARTYQGATRVNSSVQTSRGYAADGNASHASHGNAGHPGGSARGGGGPGGHSSGGDAGHGAGHH